VNLTRIAGELFRGGARTVYARGVAQGAPARRLQHRVRGTRQEDVQLLVAPELSTANALAWLGSQLETSENNGQDLIAVVGGRWHDAAAVAGQAQTNDRVILCRTGYTSS